MKGVRAGNFLKKAIIIVPLSIALIVLSSFVQDREMLYPREVPDNRGSTSGKGIISQSKELPLYTSKFWAGLSVWDIPNNNKEYNCTATVQMLYAKWLQKLVEELGYNSVEEMLSYSLKVLEIKKVFEEANYDPLEVALASNDPSLLGINHPKERECWMKVYGLLYSFAPRNLADWESADNLLLGFGLIDEDYKTATWEVIELMMAKRGLIFEKTDTDGTPAIEVWKKHKRYLPLAKEAMSGVIPGDIMTGKYYATHYPDKYTTHLTVYLGQREGEHCFAEQFGIKVKIVNLEKMYQALRTGFEAVMRPVVIIDPQRAKEFLATPLSNYELGQWSPRILIFKANAREYFDLLQQKFIVAKSSRPLDEKSLSAYLEENIFRFL